MIRAEVFASDFQILKGKSKKNVKAAVVSLRGMQELPPGIIESVGAPRRQTYRIEAIGGLQSGQSYIFEYKGEANDGKFFVKRAFVHIDDQTVDMNEASVQRIGPPHREPIQHREICGDRARGLAVVQSFRIDGPARWKPYKNHLFTLHMPLENTPWLKQDRPIELHYLDGRALSMWETRPLALCASDLGDSTKAAGMSAWLAFFEIDDVWHQVKAARFTLDEKIINKDKPAAP